MTELIINKEINEYNRKRSLPFLVFVFAIIRRIKLDRSYLTLFAIFSIKLNNSFLQQLNSKNNGPVFLFETILGILTVFCLLLQQVARMDKD